MLVRLEMKDLARDVNLGMGCLMRAELNESPPLY
jgi:hypothetical protein